MSVAAILAVLAGFTGLAVLAVLTVSAYRQIRSLGSTVARSADAIAAAGVPPRGTESESADQPNVW